jgi:hypothetical protein
VFPTEPRTWPLFDWNLDFLELLGAYRLAALAFGLAALVAAAVLGLR